MMMNDDNPEAAPPTAGSSSDASKPLNDASSSKTSRLLCDDNNNENNGPPNFSLATKKLPSEWHLEGTKLLVGFSWSLWVLHMLLSRGTAKTSFWWGLGVCLFISISNVNLAVLLLVRMNQRGSRIWQHQSNNHNNNNDTNNNNSSTSVNGSNNAASVLPIQPHQQQPRFQSTTNDNDGFWQKTCFHVWPLLLSVWCWLYYFNRHMVTVKFNYQIDMLMISIGFLWSTMFLSWALGRLPSQPFGSSQTILMLATCLLFSIAGVTVFGHRRRTQVAPIKSLLYSAQESQTYIIPTDLYNGDAYVRDVTLTDPDNTRVYCQEDYWSDVIPITIDVYFGGSWACPTMPSTECLATISSEVSCDMFFVDYFGIHGLLEGTSDDDSNRRMLSYKAQVTKVATNQDYYDYVQRHYHNRDYEEDDDKADNAYDDAYDPYGFDDDDTYDPGSSPANRGGDFYHNTETIMGNCETCQAMSQPAVIRTVNKACHATALMYTFVGALVGCLGVCLASWMQQRRATMASKTTDSPKDGGERSSSSYTLGQWA